MSNNSNKLIKLLKDKEDEKYVLFKAGNQYGRFYSYNQPQITQRVSDVVDKKIILRKITPHISDIDTGLTQSLKRIKFDKSQSLDEIQKQQNSILNGKFIANNAANLRIDTNENYETSGGYGDDDDPYPCLLYTSDAADE